MNTDHETLSYIPSQFTEEGDSKVIGMSLVDTKEIYTTQEFFSCELEYSRLLKFFEEEFNKLNLQLTWMNVGDDVRGVALLILTRVWDKLIDVIENHQILTTRRRNCARRQLEEFINRLKSSEHHRIKLMDIDSGCMTSIDREQDNLIEFLDTKQRSTSKPHQTTKQKGFILLSEGKEVPNSFYRQLQILDETCFKNLGQIKEKHCNTYEFILENVREARIERLASTTSFFFKTDDYWNVATLTSAFNLYYFDPSGVHKATTILYYTNAGISFLRLALPNIISLGTHTMKLTKCSQSVLFMRQALVEAKLHCKETPCSEFNVEYYLSMKLCKGIETLELPPEVSDHRLESDMKIYQEELKSYLSQRKVVLDRIQSQSDNLTDHFAETEEKIIVAKGLIIKTLGMQFRNLDLSVAPYEKAIQNEIDNLSSINERCFVSANFSERSSLSVEFQKLLEFVRQQNSEVVQHLQDFKQSLIDQHKAISPKLGSRYYSQSYRGRISIIMVLCSIAALVFFAVFTKASDSAYKIREKLTPSEKEYQNLEYYMKRKSDSFWFTIVFQGLFNVFNLIDMVTMLIYWLTAGI